MKKIIGFILVNLLVLSATVCFAAPGDAKGFLYYTDILTYINHSPVTSYNIGGKTIIDAEILNWHYGFDVYWRPETRRLEITDKGGIFESLQAMKGSLLEKAEGKVGEVFARFYETDIVTLLNEKEIESYNIDGRTFIVAENMREHGYNVEWNEEKRILIITKPADFYKIETDYGTIKTRENFQTVFDGQRIYQDNRYDSNQIFKVHERGFGLTGEDGETVMIDIPSGKILYGPHQFSSIKLSDAEKILNAEINLKENKTSAHTDHINGVSYDTEEFSYAIEINYDENVAPEKTPFDGYPEFKDANLLNVYSLSMPLFVNGEESAFTNPHPKTGGEFTDEILIADGEIYIPCNTVAKLLGYTFGS